MDELIILYLEQKINAADIARLMTWRSANPTNEERFQQVCDIWNMTAQLGDVPATPMPSADDILGSSAAASSAPPTREAAAAPYATHGQPAHGRLRALFAAAVAAVCITGGAIAGRTLLRVDDAPLAYTSIQTAVDERTTISLYDGSTIRLGPLSSVEISEDGGRVVADLDGRAFFGIATDREDAFVVRTPYGEAVVLGTRFEVRSEQDQLQVLVVEGQVRVTPEANQSGFLLGPLQLGSVTAGGQASKATLSSVHDRLAWMGRMLVFRDTPLLTVIDELEHKYGAEITLEDRQLESTLITASFLDQPLGSVIEVICEMLNVTCKSTEQAVVIGRVVSQ